MVLVPDREKLKTCLFVSTEYTNVTDRQTDGHTDRQTPNDGISRAYTLHLAAKTTSGRTKLLLCNNRQLLSVSQLHENKGDDRQG